LREKTELSKLGKRKIGALSLNKLLAGKIQKGRKKKKVVSFNDFIVVFPPLEKLAPCQWEGHMYHAMHAIVVHLIAEEIGHRDPSNSRPWMEVDLPCDHPKCESDPNRIYEGDIIPNLDLAFSTGADPYDDKDPLAENGLYQEMVVPMACAFVHKTAWMTRLKNFRVSSWEFMEQVKQMGENFCNSERLERCIYSRAEKYEWSSAQTPQSSGRVLNRAEIKTAATSFSSSSTSWEEYAP
jgi:hypothetical protein